MGWVTLTLRKTELKGTHSEYQMQLLRISRTKRQEARSKHFEQMQMRNEQRSIIRQYDEEYRAQRDMYTGAMKELSGHGEGAQIPINQTDAQGNTTSTNYSRADLQNSLDAAREDHQSKVNDAKAQFDDELQMIEEEANDIETELDQEQVEIEAQLEAISQEIQAVGEAISSQVQASTIKLS